MLFTKVSLCEMPRADRKTSFNYRRCGRETFRETNLGGVPSGVFGTLPESEVPSKKIYLTIFLKI
jgi:hypothetical protein